MKHLPPSLAAIAFTLLAVDLTSAEPVTFNTTTEQVALKLFKADGKTPYATAEASGEITIGDNTPSSAKNATIWAKFSKPYRLHKAGDAIVLSGKMTKTGDKHPAEHFRIGLYNTHQSIHMGYFGTSDACFNSSKCMFLKRVEEGAFYSSIGVKILAMRDMATGNLIPGTSYTFRLELKRNSQNGIDYDFDISEETNDKHKLAAMKGTDASPDTFEFDRTGFTIGALIDATQAKLSNVNISFTCE